jgi:hypothetical protein
MDNAALLYYQAFMIINSVLKRDEATMKMLCDLPVDKIKPDEKSKLNVESYRRVIDLAVTAAKIPNCDWGLDYSKGLLLNIPHLGQCRPLAQVILADAQILTSKADYKKALSRCLTAQKMGHHISQGNFICYLQGKRIIDAANECIQGILPDASEDLEILKWLKKQLTQTESRTFPFKTCVEIELKQLSIYMKKETAEKAFQPDFYKWAKEELPKTAAKLAKKAPEDFFAKNKKYWNNHASRVKACLEQPYKDAYLSLKKLLEKAQQEPDNPDAAMTAFLAANWPAAFTIQTKTRTFSNAVRAALEIYIIKAETGKLQDKPPVDLPQDLFSGKDFEYDRGDNGFILRCRGKDLLKEKIHEYEFKVSK